MLLKNLVIGLSVLIMASCASTKSISGEEKVSKNQEYLKKTGEKLASAQEELEDFQDTLKDLESSFKSSDVDGKTRDEAIQTVQVLSANITQARGTMEKLRVENRAAKADLDRRLKNAASENQKMIEGE